MSPTQFNAKKDNLHNQNNNNNNTSLCPPHLKINKDYHFIKKPSSSSPPSSSSSSSASSLVNGVVGSTAKPPQRHPVIIYTHSPKVIHTHPRDFMALVQKLTGLQQTDDDSCLPPLNFESGSEMEENKSSKNVGSEDNESSSVVTDENYCSSIGDGQVNSCFMPPPNNPYVSNINMPVLTPNVTSFMCLDQPFLNYTDSLFYNGPNIRGPVGSGSTMEGMNEFCEY